MNETLKLKQRKIEAWKVEKKAHLLEDETEKISTDQMISEEFDQEILEQFLKTNLHHLADNGSKKEFEDMLGFYLDKVDRRENSIQSSYGTLLQIRAEIEVMESERAKLEEVLFEQDHDYH